MFCSWQMPRHSYSIADENQMEYASATFKQSTNIKPKYKGEKSPLKWERRS